MNEKIAILRYTSEALATLKELANTSPELWRNAESTDFQEVLAEYHVENATEETGLVAQGPITMPMPETRYLRQRTDAASLAFHQNIPHLTTRDISDPGLLAWLSCNFLQNYGQARWTMGNNQSLTRWVNLHYLAEGGLDLTNWSAAGRPLWLAHTALKAAQELSAITPRQIVQHFSRNPEQYHACMDFQIMRSANVLAEFIMALVTEAEGNQPAGSQGASPGEQPLCRVQNHLDTVADQFKRNQQPDSRSTDEERKLRKRQDQNQRPEASTSTGPRGRRPVHSNGTYGRDRIPRHGATRLCHICGHGLGTTRSIRDAGMAERAAVLPHTHRLQRQHSDQHTRGK